MYRTALQTSARALRASGQANLRTASRRLASTAAAPRKSTWRGAAARWGLAVGAIYWYNTSPLFADEPTLQTRLPPAQFSEADNQTVDALLEEKRRETLKSSSPRPPAEPESPVAAVPSPQAPANETAMAAEALEDEAGQQGAFNPETGEINWDCPCLGGMAHGPCGEEFKAAFSCFVYSDEEPKGIECIDKFQHMQDCFRLHPEIYAAELAEDEEGEAPGLAAEDAPEPPKDLQKTSEQTPATPSTDAPSSKADELSQQLRAEDPVAGETPKQAYDATDANKDTKQ
ncbi:hypothetical protein GQ53DRAFT_436541 [Thozetella sp. PMI_491]|nr:hypothetical protein GQ53DRAFT_436541 [Thozetella sp. PMI_491]